MRSVEDVRHIAFQLKAKLVKRANNLEQMITRKAKSDAGTIRRLHPEVYETLERDIKLLQDLNIRDSVMYATLRWVLCITDDINYDDLQLNE